MIKPVLIGLAYLTNDPSLFRKRLETAGPSYIKIGQLISMRSDVFGKTLSKEMEKLQENVKNVSWDDLSKGLDTSNFTDINTAPLGTASISQVHLAKYKGRTVALKIKKPNIVRDLKNDIETLKKYALIFPGISSSVEEFENIVNKELDFKKEVQNIQLFNSIYSYSDTVKIPRVYHKLSSDNMIVMEYVEKLNTKPDVKRLINVFIEQLLYEGVIHGDLHGGNIGTSTNGKIVLYDFGNVIRIPKSYKMNIMNLISQIQDNDSKSVLKTLKSMGFIVNNEDVSTQFIIKFFDYISTMDIKSLSFDPNEVQEKIPMVMDKLTFSILRSYSLLEGYCKKTGQEFNYDDIFSSTLETLYLDPDYIALRSKQDLIKFLNLNK
jgi:ubiquinone biosynthesis protein